MMNINHLSSNDIAALLRFGGNAPTPSMPANLLLSRATNANNANALVALLAGGSYSSAPSPSPSSSSVSSTEAALITLLLLKQREDQEKEFLIRQLMALVNAPSQQQQQQSQPTLSYNEALELALLLQQQKSQEASAPPFAAATSLSALSLLNSASSALLGSPTAASASSTAPTSAFFNDVALAKILQAHGGQGAAALTSAMSLSAATLHPTTAREIPSFASSAVKRMVPASNNGSSSSLEAAAASSSSPAGMSAATLNLPADRRRKGRTGTFPQKLHQMLSELEGLEGGKEIASFLPHGRSFAIHKPRDFVKFVMTKYFVRMSRFSSFQRQVSLA